MARINTNVASLIAQQSLANSQQMQDTALERLSTGLKINSGADDPAGLIVSQGLQSQMAGITQAVSNSSQANNVVATAEGALSQVSSLLLNIKSLIVQSANSGPKVRVKFRPISCRSIRRCRASAGSPGRPASME